MPGEVGVLGGGAVKAGGHHYPVSPGPTGEVGSTEGAHCGPGITSHD